jgi:hypothetical protein
MTANRDLSKSPKYFAAYHRQASRVGYRRCIVGTEDITSKEDKWNL